MPHIKLVTVGDTGVGKTSLLLSHSLGSYEPATTVPAASGPLGVSLMLAGTIYNLTLWDTVCEMDALRVTSYADTDVFIVCFALDSRESFDSVRARWKPELEREASGVPIVLVGTKSDLAGQEISSEEGQTAASAIGAAAYVACSALQMEKVGSVFSAAAGAAVNRRDRLAEAERRPQKKKSAACSLV
jgi:small GTP-binding protein